MAWVSLKNKQKITKIISRLILEKTEVKVFIKDNKTEFISKITRINPGDLSSFIIEKLRPDNGNALIQSASKILLEFTLSNKSCRCSTNYMGISSTPPYFGFFLRIPESIEVDDMRYEERVTYEGPDFVSAEFKLGKGSNGAKLYELDVMDCSSHGLGLIIKKENFDLINKLKTGDTIKDMTFFATQAMVKFDCLVKHITKIEKGEYQGLYQLGIESREIIDACRAKK